MDRPDGISEKTGDVLYTIGHSNHDEQHFVELLQTHGIEVLVDVRSQPYSRYASHFNATPIKRVVSEAGLKYLFLGAELGGRPEAESESGEPLYDEQGHVLYRNLARSERFLRGIDQLEQAIGQFRLAIMCSEEEPAVCHRHLLIGRVLRERGYSLLHIRGDGRIDEDDQIKGFGAQDERQGMLFAELERDPWRSLQSISPRPRSSASPEDHDNDSV